MTDERKIELLRSALKDIISNGKLVLESQPGNERKVLMEIVFYADRTLFSTREQEKQP